MLDFLANHITSEVDFVLLQPTSPFRQIAEWPEINKVFQDESSSLFSVHSADSPHPKKSFQLLSGNEPDLNTDLLFNISSPAQKLGHYFAPDGAFYVNRISQLLRTRTFLELDSRIFVRSGVFATNIDTEEDFLFAEYAAHRFNL